MLGLAMLLAADLEDDPAALLKQTGYPLSEAIAKASALAKEGTVVSAELENDDGKLIYSVGFALGAKTLEIELDARTGELVRKSTEEEDQSAAAKALKVPLAQAIENALRKVPGLAFEAEAGIEEGELEIEVKIVSDGKVHKVQLDANGAVVKVKTKKEEKK
jgi:uncharacterized membrane protein YkoI